MAFASTGKMRPSVLFIGGFPRNRSRSPRRTREIDMGDFVQDAYARSPGDWRGAALRTHQRSAIPRGGIFLLVRRLILSNVCDRRKQQQ